MNIKEGFKTLYTANGGDEADLKELSGNNNQHVISTIYGDGLSTKLPKNVVDNVEKMAKGGGSGSGELVVTVEMGVSSPRQGQTVPTFNVVSVDKTYEEIEEAFNSRRGIVCNVYFIDDSNPPMCFKFSTMYLLGDLFGDKTIEFSHSENIVDFNAGKVKANKYELTLNYLTGNHTFAYKALDLQTKTN